MKMETLTNRYNLLVESKALLDVFCNNARKDLTVTQHKANFDWLLEQQAILEQKWNELDKDENE